MTLTATSFDWVRQLVHKESAIVLQPGNVVLHQHYPSSMTAVGVEPGPRAPSWSD